MRFFARDVRDALKDYLEDNFNTTLSTIDTERTETTPPVISFITGKEKNQFPEMYIDVISSTIETDEIHSDETYSTEKFEVDITVKMKYSNDSIHNYIENYIEALQRLLNNQTIDPQITYIFATSTLRVDLYDNSGQVLRVGGVKFDVRVN